MAMTINAAKLSREYVTITVTGLRALNFRHWLAAKIFVLGAWAASTGLEIAMDDTDVPRRPGEGYHPRADGRPPSSPPPNPPNMGSGGRKPSNS